MANKRVFDEVQGCVINGVSIGGITSCEVTQDYVDNIQADEDGAAGPAQVDQAGEQVAFTVRTTDVLAGIDLLKSTPGVVDFFGRESGAATYLKTTLGKASTSSLMVMHSASWDFSRQNYAVLTVNGLLRMAAADTFEDVVQYLAAQSAPSETDPNRMWKPTKMEHGSLTLLHPLTASVRLTGRLLKDYGDDDVGVTAVDVGGHSCDVSATCRDAGSEGADAYDRLTKVLRQGLGDFKVTLERVAAQVGEADQVLTVRNVRFRSRNRGGQRGYTGHNIGGVAQWRDADGTARTLTHATPAERLINFADVA